MPTLHIVTEKTKKLLKILGIVLVVVVSIFLIFRLGLFIRDTFFPKAPPPPTVTFGKLKALDFPESVSEGLTFEIDTVTGELPVLADENKIPLDRVIVNKIHNPEFSLLDLQNSKATVAEIGFLGREAPSDTENIYLWSTIAEGLQRNIRFNIVNKNFEYSTSFRQSDRILAGLNMPDRVSATEKAKEFLESMSLFPTDIDEEKNRSQLLSLKGTELIPVETLREAGVIRVNFYQKNVNNFPIFYDTPPFSSLNFYISGGERFNPDVVEGNFYHQLITEEAATYPIKPIEVAFEELKNGGGYIAANFLPEKKIKIKEVELGYYSPSSKQDYLMPVYVFKGLNDEFFAYVSAIPDGWLEK